MRLHVHKSKRHTQIPTHGLASTLRMCTAISPGQWQPRTAVSNTNALLGLISMAANGTKSPMYTAFTAEEIAKHPFKRQLNSKA